MRVEHVVEAGTETRPGSNSDELWFRVLSSLTGFWPSSLTVGLPVIPSKADVTTLINCFRRFSSDDTAHQMICDTLKILAARQSRRINTAEIWEPGAGFLIPHKYSRGLEESRSPDQRRIHEAFAYAGRDSAGP
jgi:hypothetical protein